jgi:hypothetical protein
MVKEVGRAVEFYRSKKEEFLAMMEQKAIALRAAKARNDDAEVERIWKEYQSLAKEMQMANPALNLSPEETQLKDYAKFLTFRHHAKPKHGEEMRDMAPADLDEELKAAAEEENKKLNDSSVN